MKPLYTNVEFEIAKSRDLLPLECEFCKKTFYKPKNYIQACLRSVEEKTKKQNGKVCSISCLGLMVTSLETFTTKCSQCGISVRKKNSEIVKRKSENYFCSQSCAATYNNTHKTKGTRMSKLEIYLQKELVKLYSNLEFHFNRKDAINSELDIYVPSLKLAFELNGIFHYEPIYGSKKLSQIQNNDARKFQACLEKGISLCIIDVSSFGYYKESGAKKYLDIIINIIQNLPVF